MHVGRVRRRSPDEAEVLGLLRHAPMVEVSRLHSIYCQTDRRPLCVLAEVVVAWLVMEPGACTDRAEAGAIVPEDAPGPAGKSSLEKRLVVEVRTLATLDDERLASSQHV